VKITTGSAQGFAEIDGFRCYAPHLADDSSFYPLEGFDISVDAEANSFWCRSRNRIIRAVIDRFAAPGRPLEMLEIGCGIGGVVSELRRIGRLRITASEISLHGLRYARARFPDVEFVQLDATEMPFESAFDLVGAFDVLEHIDADDRAMRGAYQALRPGGLFLVTVPQHAWLWSTLDDAVHHKRRYDRCGLLGRLRAAGFDVLFCSSFVTALFPAMAASRLLSRVRRPARSPSTQITAEVVLPSAANRVCDLVMRADELALAAGVPLPFGGSLLAVARRP